jgi:hypothetical protein
VRDDQVTPFVLGISDNDIKATRAPLPCP